MLRINRQTDYAVRVILALAKRGRAHDYPQNNSTGNVDPAGINDAHRGATGKDVITQHLPRT